MKYTDNVRFNHKLNFAIFAIAAAYFYYQGQHLANLLVSAASFTLIYSISSAFIQPDLDQTVHRPGKDSFPLGKFKNTKFGEAVFPALYPINRIWFYFWQPYGYLWTHRGLSHWPIIGTWTRAGYVLAVFWIMKTFLKIPFLNTPIDYLKLFFPIKDFQVRWELVDLYWINYILPVFLADLIHFLVDLFDSIRNNKSFASSAHEPGLLTKTFNPQVMKYHKKALKKAKANSKRKK